MPGRSGVTVVTMLVCFFSFAREAAGASRARHSLRPLISGARDSCTARANSRRGNAKVCLMNAKAPHSHASSPGLTGRPSIPETPENNREAAAYWVVRSSRTTTVVWEATKQSSFPVTPWIASRRLSSGGPEPVIGPRTSQPKQHCLPVQNAIRASVFMRLPSSARISKSRGARPQLAPANPACNAESANNKGRLRGYVLAPP
jgi:hypothetical protein